MNSVKVWLVTSIIIILLMLGVGGITRLSRAGLSITQWQPITGAFPPITIKQWQQEYNKYQNTPEYRSYPIAIERFKTLFFIEYFHRLLGRIIALILIIPYLFFFRRLPKVNKIIGTASIILIFLQGWVGWYMVKSGLIDIPAVSPYRLCLHLLLALLLFHLQLLALIKLSHNFVIKPPILPGLYLVLLVGQIAVGALVAGSKAGFFCNDFWQMEVGCAPNNSIYWLQFVHRALGWSSLIGGMLIYLVYRHKSKLACAVASLAFLQFALGALTLITAVHIIPASLHQVNAFLLYGANLLLFYQLKKQESYAIGAKN